MEDDDEAYSFISRLDEENEAAMAERRDDALLIILSSINLNLISGSLLIHHLGLEVGACHESVAAPSPELCDVSPFSSSYSL